MINKIINQNLLNKDPLSKKLIANLVLNEERFNLTNCYLYYRNFLNKDCLGNKIYSGILIISEKYGIVIIQCVGEDDLSEAKEMLETTTSVVFSKLIKSRKLRKNVKEIAIPIMPVLVFSKQHNFSEEDGIISIDIPALNIFFQNHNNESLNSLLIDEARSILDISNVIKKVKKDIDISKIKGKIVHEIESKIPLFDKEQIQASFFISDRAQRIRGLAGSGKTIILAKKAALIHADDENAKILYTFNTKSLYDLIKSLITRFYNELSDTPINWDNIKILHAWGGKNLEGVYYNTCIENKIFPYSLRQANEEMIDPKLKTKGAFDYVCGKALENNLYKTYDYCLIDEAQDFSENFYRLCREITKDDRVIWAYDDFQNIIDTKIQNPKDTFSIDKSGHYLELISEEQDIVLHRCYRNDRKILLVAFALGLGLYGKIVQMLQNNNHWADLGFTVIEGNSKEGDMMTIERSEDNSPIDIGEENVKVESFNERSDEISFIANRILDDIEKGVPVEEILVISLDDSHIKSHFLSLKAILEKESTGVFNLFETSFNNTSFKQEACITMSSVYKAKGNEACSVYVLGTDAVYNKEDSVIERNKLFTAITRAKLWVTITGVGDNMQKCKREVDSVLADFPKLKFRMPNLDELKTIQRDYIRRQNILKRFEDLRNEGKEVGLIIPDIVDENE